MPFMECGSASYRRGIEQGGSFAVALQSLCSWSRLQSYGTTLMRYPLRHDNNALPVI